MVEPRTRSHGAIGSVVLLGALLGPSGAVAEPAATEAMQFKVGVPEDGVYGVTHQDLVAAGLPGAPISSELIRALHRGEEIPLFVDDGGDGAFGPGDHLEFLGSHPTGTAAWFSEFTNENVYWLRFDGEPTEPAPLRFTPGTETSAPEPDGIALEARARDHLEGESVMVRFRPPPDRPPTDFWFWHRLDFTNRNPFAIALDLSSASPDPEAELEVRLHLRGWSYQPQPSRPDVSLPADHRAELRLAGRTVAVGEWSGQDDHLVSAVVPLASLDRAHPVELSVVIPYREGPEGPVIDVALVDWIELEYPLEQTAPRRQTAWHTRPAQASGSAPRGALRLRDANGTTTVFSEGRRWSAPGPGAGGERLLQVGADARLWMVPGSGLRRPSSLVRDRPSELRRADQQADYLMIAHPELLDALRPLAEDHRADGLTVRLVDVEDVFDEFDHGLQGPHAIRRFISHAFHEWQAPAPRFVLLAGDASWDVKQQGDGGDYADWTYRPGEPPRRFRKNASTDLDAPVTGSARNLVPTWGYWGFEGHAASDNWFVSVDGDDHLPDLAVGRIPAATPEELRGVVSKIRSYRNAAGVGPWRHRALLITNETRGAHRRSDRVAGILGATGFESRKIYPQPEDADNRHHQQAILDSFDEGNLLVHFYGHGGRYIWQTGPPDPQKNHDLFTLDHLDQLAPRVELPVVLSMTCYSAPFDHPTADSIGEKFLRLQDRGAIAVIAASWRNSPSIRLSQSLVETMLSEETIGEALLKTKRSIRREVLVETYNLLGDPALRLARPSAEASLEPQAGGHSILVDAPYEEFAGSAIVTWLDTAGRPVESAEIEVDGLPFTATAPPTPSPDGQIGGAAVYLWDPQRQLDAAATLLFDSASNEGPEESP